MEDWMTWRFLITWKTGRHAGLDGHVQAVVLEGNSSGGTRVREALSEEETLGDSAN